MSKDTNTKDEASLSQEDLQELITRVKRCFIVKDRKHGIKRTTYEKCFVGKEAVQSLIGGIAADPPLATIAFEKVSV